LLSLLLLFHAVIAALCGSSPRQPDAIFFPALRLVVFHTPLSPPTGITTGREDRKRQRARERERERQDMGLGKSGWKGMLNENSGVDERVSRAHEREGEEEGERERERDGDAKRPSLFEKGEERGWNVG